MKLILAFSFPIAATSYASARLLNPRAYRSSPLFCTRNTNMQEPPSNNDCAISYATLADISSIVACTNDAYVADQFFKKPLYHNRFTEEDVRDMIQATNSIFIIAKDTSQTDIVCGSMYLQWTTEARHTVGKFSAVAVRGASQQRGVGRLLVRSAENYILNLAAAEATRNDTVDLPTFDSSTAALGGSLGDVGELGATVGATAELAMGVINLRTDLFPWYRKQGFQEEGDMPWDAELARIIEEGYEHVCLIKMRKTLL